MALLQYVRVIMSWGWVGNKSFREKSYIYFSKFVEKLQKIVLRATKAIMVMAVPFLHSEFKGKKNFSQYVALAYRFLILSLE